MFKKRLLSCILVLTLLVTSLSVLTGIIKFDLFANAESKNLVVNSSFAERNEGWSKAGYGGAYDATTVADGAYVREGDEGKVFSFNARNDKLWQYVKVEKNTTYTFSFDYFRFADAGWFQARIGLANQVSTSLTDGKIVCNNDVKGEKTWETFTTTVNSGDYEYICIYLVQADSASTNWNDYVNGKNIWVDNVQLIDPNAGNDTPPTEPETPDDSDDKNLVVNSSFAERNEGWSKAGYGGAYDATTVADGAYVREGDEGKVFSFNARNDKLWQYVKVEKNTTYTFSFDYFRFADAGWFQARIGLANQVSTSLTDGEIVCNNDVKGEKTWETFTTTVNSGDYEYICIYLVQADSASTNWNDYVNGKNIWVDNVQLIDPNAGNDTPPTEPETPDDSDDKNLVVNSSFAERNEGWSKAGYGGAYDATTVADGAYVREGDEGKVFSFNARNDKLWQYVKVEKNTTYTFSFDYFRFADAGWFQARIGLANQVSTSLTDGKIVCNNDVKGEKTWETFTTTVNSGDYEYICIYLVQADSASTNWNDYVNGKNIWIDNVRLEPIGSSGSLIGNGGFEAGALLWDIDEDGFEVLEGKGEEDGDVLHVKPAYHKTTNQKIAVEKGKNYKLTIKYKGTVDNTVSSWAISTTKSMSWHKAIARGKLETTDAWKEATAVFTADQDAYYIILHSSVNSDFYIDSVDIVSTEEAANVVKPARAYDAGHASGSMWNTSYAIPLDGYDKMVNGDFVNAKSNAVNDAANFFVTSNAGTPAATIVSGDKAGASYFGNKSLKFTAGSKEESLSIPIKLEKNKKYYLGFYYKSEYYYAKNGEWTRFSYGLADAESKTYLNIADNRLTTHDANSYTDDIQNLGISDNSWHYVAVAYSTNDQTDFEFLIRGRHLSVYIDKIYVWEAAYGQPVPSLLKDMADVEVTNTDPQLLGIKEGGENHVKNFNFEDAVNTYWFSKDDMRSDLPGDTLFIKDSGDANQGEALVYQNYRKYPTNAYYFKWVDVEPNTEYTFSAKYAITEKGNGAFGMISGYNSADLGLCNDFDGSVISENLIFPTVIAKYKFDDSNYLYDHSWQYAAFSFNTNDRNRVGFFVLDDGGTAYIDDIRIFKTSDAAKLVEGDSNFPTELVSKDPSKFAAIDGNIKVKMGTKLSEIVAGFEKSSYIKVFDENGKQVTDLNQIARNGLEIRLLNGPQIAARAKILLPGDVTADGILDAKDLEIIIKHITMEEIIRDEVKLPYADANCDGKIDIYDVNFNTAAAKAGTADFVLTGPEKFSVGDEIEVVLKAGANGIRGLNGLIKYNESRLEFVSAALDMDGNWMLSTDATGGELTFAAVDADKNNATVKDGAVITFTFKVGNVQKYSDIQVLLAQCFSTTGGDLLTSAEYMWTPGKVPATNNDANNGSNTSKPSTTPGGPTSTTVQAANRLAEFRIEGVKLNPAFDPEIKEYTATVPYSVKEVKVIAVAADENATVKIGDTKLEYVGKNVVAVQVTSEDGLKRTYRVVINREAPEDDKGASSNAANVFPVWAIVLIAAGALLLLAAIVIIVIIILKRRKKD